MSRQIDPILLEVLKNGFEAIADEMALILMRTAHSPIVRDAMDYSTALCNARGETIAQGVTTPMHLGSFYDAMNHLVQTFKGRIKPGDVFVGNDPYIIQGQHLPDIYVIEPIFAEGRICAWATTIAHHADVGGLVPGSNSIGATEIHQEGLRLPFLKLAEGGVENPMLFEIIAANVRVPEQVIGDLRAQMAAARAGRQGFAKLLERYGANEIEAYTEALQDQAELFSRKAIEAIPDGRYSFVDHIDGLGADPEPIELHLTLTVSGSEITADWTGTNKQVKGGINAPLSFCKSNVYAALRSIMPEEVPNCHGYTRPITVTAPPGTLVSCVYPAPCGARGITGYRIIDCIFGALAEALPDKIAADNTGGSTLPSFGGQQGGKPFVFSECVMGVWGATSAHDGQSGVPHMGSNQSNVPIEMIEADYPLRIERYGFVADTGGAGEFRGGVSIQREWRSLADDTYFGVRSDKAIHPPHGLFGGGEGKPAFTEIEAGNTLRAMPPLATQAETLNAGALVRHRMAGGGGYGDPLRRDPVRVAEDVLDGLVSVAAAATAYGVVLSDPAAGTVDEAATAALRADMRATQGTGG
ncbi:hydantoinase B/oxoprolinase family protein [Salipiger sp. PrR007]|uniref:hydantoinase B/oxoprolinase family protein n=1 Tax=Salipiger sp. PrR007 TaxID=2706884 RepID=UPI0013BBD979|nr:hydantoinase B/oxoprolinase family protein [Salipiger sp. PrR007]NDW33087.1 hydantoinase B/oxoprolinase family protein [Salipiger sp. PrR007]